MGHARFVMFTFGEFAFSSEDEETILTEAQMHCNQYICDFWRNCELPKKLTDEDKASLDVHVFDLQEMKKLDLPFQDWVDDWYADKREAERDEEQREYKRYLELREKWEPRRLREQGPKLTNC
jgi:hypothetical protein